MPRETIINVVQLPVGSGVVRQINLASWADESATRLAAHEPEATEVVVEFDAENDEPDLMH